MPQVSNNFFSVMHTTNLSDNSLLSAAVAGGRPWFHAKRERVNEAKEKKPRGAS